MRGRTWIITVAVVVAGAVPAVANTRDQALRKAPAPVTKPATPPATVAPARPARPVVVTPAKPSAVWIPSPAAGIKWNIRFR